MASTPFARSPAHRPTQPKDASIQALPPRERPALGTRVDPDGVRVLPSRFELCDMGDLIILIGEASAPQL
jgi:hypothetical protein